MSDNLREEIITSESAKRMVSRVSPIYDDAYVGLWVFQAIGIEYDKLWAILDSMPDQLFPESATWSIGLWEQRYGISTDESLNIDERRQAVIEMRAIPSPLTPARMEAYLKAMTGRVCHIEDYVAPYTFGVYLGDYLGDAIPVSQILIREYLNKHKQSHMSYTLAFMALTNVLISVSTAFWRYPYKFPGQHNAGQLPAINRVYGHAEADAVISESGSAYKIPWTMAGELPEISTTAELETASISAVSQAENHKISYVMCGSLNCGT